MPALARVYRGTQIESIHTGSIAVVDSLGRVLACVGEINQRICLRSAAKPFQAFPLLECGGADQFGLTSEEIALTCGSHGGEPVHVAAAAALLRKGEFDESDLLCGAHAPYDEKSAADLRASGDEPSALHNNCSGKHAGMLLTTQVMDMPTARYSDADHPLQILMRSTLADFTGLAANEIPIAIDGCGIPAYFVSLYRTALAYARLMATGDNGGAPGALDRYTGSASHVVEAMTAFPYYVAGAWSLTTPLMESFDGDLLAKEGAEGVYAMALSPALTGELTDRLDLTDHAAIGIAIKIDDGSMGRGRNPAILRTLQALGIDLDAHPALQSHREWPLRNAAGTLVGDVRSDFELEFL